MDSGADVSPAEAAVPSQITELHRAVWQGEDRDAVAALCSQPGRRLDALMDYGCACASPRRLHFCQRHSLLRYTVYMLACEKGCVRTVEALVQAGCSTTLRNGHATCAGGALFLHSQGSQHPFQANVTITHSAFSNNHAQQGGDDIKVVGGPCPAPGKACGSSCCFSGDYASLNVTLSSS